jgi:hypothetical protein
MSDGRGWSEHDDVCAKGHVMVWASASRLVCPVCVTRQIDDLRDELVSLRAALKRARAEARQETLQEVADWLEENGYVDGPGEGSAGDALLRDFAKRALAAEEDGPHHVTCGCSDCHRRSREFGEKLRAADTETESGARCPDPRAHRRKTPHSCDVPGCVTCNNPDGPTEEKGET